jgi:hypothetical protein
MPSTRARRRRMSFSRSTDSFWLSVIDISVRRLNRQSVVNESFIH